MIQVIRDMVKPSSCPNLGRLRVAEGLNRANKAFFEIILITNYFSKVCDTSFRD